MKNKKAVMTQFALILTLFASLLMIAQFSGVIDIASLVGFGENVYVANWGTIECEKSPHVSTYEKYLDQQNFFSCGLLEYTEECGFEIKSTCTSWWCSSSNGKYRECDSAGENCLGWVNYDVAPNTKKTIPSISNNRGYEFSLGIGTVNEDYTIIIKKWNQWQLRSEEYGLDWISGSEGCKLPSWTRDQVEIGQLNDRSCIEAGQLSFENACRIINYQTGWVTVLGVIENYQGEDVVCQARSIYEIDEFEFVDGSRRLIQGNRIPVSIDCCPFEPNCNDNFKWDSTTPDECNYDYECLNGGKLTPIDNTRVKKQTCEIGVCVWGDPISVECTTNAECLREKGEGYICSLSTWTCEESQTPFVCGDGFCDELIGESIGNCIEDCSCPDGEILTTRIEKIDCVIGFPIYVGCDERVTEECINKSGISWLRYILIAGGVIILFFFRRPILAIVKGGLGKLGMRF